MATQLSKKDAFNGKMKSFMTVFVPKLKPNYVKPCCFLNVSNGNGSALIRFESPEDLAKTLRDLANRITTLDWTDKWQCLQDISENLQDTGNLILDEDFVDVDEFKDKWIEEPTLQLKEPIVALQKTS